MLAYSPGIHFAFCVSSCSLLFQGPVTSAIDSVATPQSDSAITALLCAGAVLLIVLSLAIALWLGRKAFRLAGSSWSLVAPIFGQTPLARLLAFAIVAFFNPRLVSDLLTLPLAIVIQTVELLFNRATQLITHSEHVPVQSGALASSFTSEFSTWQKAVIEDARTFNTTVFSSSFIAALATWAILGHIVSTIGSKHGRQRVVALYSGLRSSFRDNVALCLILCAGGYMSIAAIVATPWLGQATVTTTAERTSLSDRVTQAMNDELFNKTFPAEFAKGLVSTVEARKTLNATPKSTPEAAPRVSAAEDRLKQVDSEWQLALPGGRENSASRAKTDIVIESCYSFNAL